MSELRTDLDSDVALLRKEAMKKVVAGMTIGKDFSPLFPDVLKCMQTADLELKKLVYLYLINYAKIQPELAILAINTFCKDSEDSNPLVRSLSIRTMGCIRIPQILDYIIEPLRRGLKDGHPYVRKSAALCVAKVFDLSVEVAEDCGFLDSLQELLQVDNNPMVISNVLAALSDISRHYPDIDVLLVDASLLKRLLVLLNECSEWGQIFILETLAKYMPLNVEEAEAIVEGVLPRLQHSNQSIVMASIRVLVKQGIMKESPLTANHPLRTVICRKLGAPLVAMTSSPTPAELQYVALRCLNLLVQLVPQLIGSDPRPFFAVYTDPAYVKVEKLEVLALVTDDESVGRVLPELADCAKDVDASLAARAVRIMARITERVTHWTSHVLDLYYDLLETLNPVTIQQVIMAVASIYQAASLPGVREAIKHWFARVVIVNEEDYNVNFGVISEACAGDPLAQASFISLISHLDIEENDSDLLEATIAYVATLTDNFALSPGILQHEILMASLRLQYRNSPRAGLRVLTRRVFELALSTSESVDLQDRARFLKSLAETEQKKTLIGANEAIFAADDGFSPEPAITEPAVNVYEQLLFGSTDEYSDALAVGEVPEGTSAMSPLLLDELVSELSLLSSVLHRSSVYFVRSHGSQLASLKASAAKLPAAYRQLLMTSRPAVANLLALDYDSGASPVSTVSAGEAAISAIAATSPKNAVEKYANLLDLLDD